MFIHKNFSPLLKAKKKGKKEREKEKPIRTCKPGYLEDHYPVPLHWFSVHHWHKTILTGLTKFKQFAYFVPWLYIIVVARILGAFNMTHRLLFCCGYLLCLVYFFLYLVLNSIKSLISDRILSTKSSVKSKYVNKISG